MWIFLVFCHLKDSEVIRLGNLLRNPAIFKNENETYDFSSMFSDANENINQSQNMTDQSQNTTSALNQSQNTTSALNQSQITTSALLSFLDGEYNTFTPFLNVILPFLIILGVFLIVWFEPTIWRKR